MLKDIFPQNAVDLGMMKEGGILHSMFRKKEKRLYEIYLNPLMQYGPQRLVADAVAAGVDALIVPDLPYATKGARHSELHAAAVPPARRVCPWPLTWLRTADMMPTTNALSVT